MCFCMLESLFLEFSAPSAGYTCFPAKEEILFENSYIKSTYNNYSVMTYAFQTIYSKNVDYQKVLGSKRLNYRFFSNPPATLPSRSNPRQCIVAQQANVLTKFEYRKTAKPMLFLNNADFHFTNTNLTHSRQKLNINHDGLFW